MFTLMVIFHWIELAVFILMRINFSYIKLGNYEEASKLLFRRNDGKMLHIALALAKKTENLDLIKGVEFRLKRFEELDNIKASEKKSEGELHYNFIKFSRQLIMLLGMFILLLLGDCKIIIFFDFWHIYY